jgi:hypothetical protein
MSTTTKPLRLAALLEPLPTIDLGDAGVHQVEQISGVAMQIVHSVRDGDDGLALWEAAALCLPTAPRSAVLALRLGEVNGLLAIASGSAQAVLERLGNAGAPATGESSAPAPSTPSDS